MNNNDIVPGFDREPLLPCKKEKKKDIDIQLQKVDEIPDCLIISTHGFLEKKVSKWFRRQITKAIESGFNRLIFNLAEFEMVSDEIIGCFTLFLKKYLQPRKGTLVLIEVPTKIYKIFQLLGFSQFFNITDTLQEAITFLKQGASRTVPFLRIFECPICGMKLKARKAGKFRYADCKTILVITDEGLVLLGK